MADSRLRVLVCTQIFPNRVEPHSAPFNRKQIAALAKHADVEVVAAVPWLPGARLLEGRSRAAALRRVPRHDCISGLQVSHPRRAYVPKVGGLANGPLAVASYAPAFVGAANRFDIVLATWAYPDAWAAIVLGALVGLPVVVKLHGSDINVLAQSRFPRAALRAVLPRAAGVIGVSEALRDEAIALGVDSSRAFVVRNGVEHDAFSPGDAAAARRTLGLPESAPMALYVGRLEAAKGVAELLAAFAQIADTMPVHLLLVGAGSLRPAAEDLARRYPGRVHVRGEVPHDEVPVFMRACNILALPSYNEGIPNVVLEAIASGRRVVATHVGGIPEVVNHQTGTLVGARAADELAQALRHELSQEYDPQSVAAHAPGSWDDSALQLLDVMRRSMAAH